MTRRYFCGSNKTRAYWARRGRIQPRRPMEVRTPAVRRRSVAAAPQPVLARQVQAAVYVPPRGLLAWSLLGYVVR